MSFLESPAIAEVKISLRAAIPELVPAAKLGTIRFDHSRHTAGLAIDIMLDSRNAYEKMMADDIIAALIKLHSRMQWFDLIYTDWKADKTPFYFHIPGNPLYAANGWRRIRLTRKPEKPTKTTFISTGVIINLRRLTRNTYMSSLTKPRERASVAPCNPNCFLHRVCDIRFCWVVSKQSGQLQNELSSPELYHILHVVRVRKHIHRLHVGNGVERVQNA